MSASPGIKPGVYTVVVQTPDLGPLTWINSAPNLERAWEADRATLSGGIHTSRLLQAAYDRQGLENCEWRRLETCDVRRHLQRRRSYIVSMRPRLNGAGEADDLPEDDIKLPKMDARRNSKKLSRAIQRATQDDCVRQYKNVRCQANRKKDPALQRQWREMAIRYYEDEAQSAETERRRNDCNTQARRLRRELDALAA